MKRGSSPKLLVFVAALGAGEAAAQVPPDEVAVPTPPGEVAVPAPPPAPPPAQVAGPPPKR